MTWTCAQLEDRAADFLDGRLAAADADAAEAHARGCPRCAEWLDARRAVAWLRALEPLESPPGLETRILTATLAPAPVPAWRDWALWQRAWTLFLQPRVALATAAAVISFTLTLNALGVSPSVADLYPANAYRALDRRAHLGYARVVRFVNDLRVVYEIRSRLDELQPEEAPPPPPPSAKPTTPPAPEEKKSKNSTDPKTGPQSGGALRTWVAASLFLGPTGDIR
jgi:hypothetical protein